MPPVNDASHIASLVIDTLVAKGVRRFFIAPGNRSSSLVAAISKHPLAEASVATDERSLAFMALGFSKAKEEVCALVLTSGTALGNVMPAVMEASHDHVGLLIISADRPFELQNVGANQTTHQTDFFAPFAKKSVNLPCLNENTPPSSITTAIDQLVCEGMDFVSHLNICLQKPFFSDHPLPVTARSLESFSSKPQIESAHLKALFERALRFDKGLIIVGQTGTDTDIHALIKLSKTLGWPIFIDLLSPLSVYHRMHEVITHYDLALMQEADLTPLHPQAVLQIGSRFISAPLTSFIRAASPTFYAQITRSELSDDFIHSMTHRYIGAVEPALHALSHFASPVERESSYLDTWISLDQKAAKALDTSCQSLKSGTLVSLFHSLETDAPLFLGNSLTIRAACLAFRRPRTLCHLFANRGLSGIDGNIATAIGLSLGLDRSITMIIGDQTLMHDVGSLQLLKTLTHPMTIMVLNNHGGQIFASLPIPLEKQTVEHFWLNPLEIDCEKIAEAFGLAYERVDTIDANPKTKHTLIEVNLDEKICHQQRQALKKIEGLIVDEALPC